MSNRLVEIAENSARGGFFLFSGNASSTIILAVGSIAIARLLGPEYYGIFSLSLVAPAILIGLIDLGVNSALTRYSAKLRAEGRADLVASVLKSGFLFKLLLGISTSALCYTFSDSLATYLINRPEMGFYVRFASILILFQTTFVTLNSAFIGLDRMRGNALLMNIQAIVKTALSPLLIVLGFSIIGAISGHVLSYAVAGGVGSLILFKYCKGLANSSNLNFSGNLKTMLSYGLPLYFSGLLMLISGQFQTIILAHFTSNVEIGNFQVAGLLSTMVTLLTFPFTVLFPAFAKLNPDEDEFKKLFKMAVKYTALLIVPASVAVAIMARDIVYLLYGSGYNLAPIFLSFYILIYAYAGLGYVVLEPMFDGIGETKTVFKYYLVNLCVFVPLAAVFTLFYGVLGLIGALLVSNLCSLVYGLFVAGRRFGVRPSIEESMKTYLAAGLSTVPTLVFLHFSPFNHFSNVLIGGSVYLLAYLTLTPLVGGVCKHDLENLKMIFSRVRFAWVIVKPLLGYEERLLKLTYSST
jgi:O-antigen/teichoic acid export membrane protein